MATYVKTHSKIKPIAAIAAAGAIAAAAITGCTSPNPGPQPNPPVVNSNTYPVCNTCDGSYQKAVNQSQGEQSGSIGDQGPGTTTNPDNDAGTGVTNPDPGANGNYDGSS